MKRRAVDCGCAAFSLDKEGGHSVTARVAKPSLCLDQRLEIAFVWYDRLLQALPTPLRVYAEPFRRGPARRAWMDRPFRPLIRDDNVASPYRHGWRV